MNTTFNKTCPYCQSPIKQSADVIICNECSTPHHKECWDENKGCTTFGCSENPDSKKQSGHVIDVGNQTIEEIQNLIETTHQNHLIPPSNLLINCPECKSLVDENSRFCKFCGYNFLDNQTPIKRSDFEKEYIKRYKQRVSMQRKGAWMTAISLTILVIVMLTVGYLAAKSIAEYFSSPREEIKRTVLNWKEAWENKDIEKYSSYLSDDYDYSFTAAEKNEDKNFNKSERVERINWTFNRYEYIKIKFSNMKVEMNSSDQNRAVVKLDEKYESDKYSDEGKKTLYLEKGSDGHWKIYKEVFEL